MFRFILPTILIGVALAGFFLFTNPFYNEMSLKREQIASYNEALSNSKALEAERDKLTQKYNSFDPEKLSRLEKLLPDNVDNIRLILEIEKISSPYGMALKDVKYNSVEKPKEVVGVAGKPVEMAEVKGDSSRKDYGTWTLEFNTQGTYDNFLNFIRDLESNLRIVDISSIQFNSSMSPDANPSLSEAYKYNFKIKTYWLKN